MILWASLLLAAVQASAIVSPSTIDKKAISDQLTAASKVEMKLVSKRNELKAAKTAQQKKDLEAEIERLSDARAASYNEAIYLALAAYEIIPPGGMPQGKSVLRTPNLGKTVTWLPMFEDKYPHEVVNEVGKVQKGLYMDPEALAVTSADGVSRIFPETLLRPISLR